MTTNKIISQALTEGRNLLFEDEAGALLKTAGIPVNPCRAAADEEAALAAALEFGFPVALKVRSRAIPHKTDIGGVKLGLADPEAVRLAYRQIMEQARALDPAAQVTVQPMAPAGMELFAGMTRDPQFGPVIAFGLGGVLLELYQDTTFRLIPLQKEDATDMLKSIKGSKLLEGYRGQAAVHQAAVAGIILSLSKLVEDTPRLKEIDLNPVLAYPDGALAVDARIIVE